MDNKTKTRLVWGGIGLVLGILLTVCALGHYDIAAGGTAFSGAHTKSTAYVLNKWTGNVSYYIEDYRWGAARNES